MEKSLLEIEINFEIFGKRLYIYPVEMTRVC